MTVPLPPKLYFRIGEVAGLVGVEPHVLRYWEREFRSIRPTKSAKGQRVYSRKDVEALIVVKDLLYAQGFTIAGAKKRLQRAPDAGAQQTRAAAQAQELASPPILRDDPHFEQHGGPDHEPVLHAGAAATALPPVPGMPAMPAMPAGPTNGARARGPSSASAGTSVASVAEQELLRTLERVPGAPSRAAAPTGIAAPTAPPAPAGMVATGLQRTRSDLDGLQSTRKVLISLRAEVEALLSDLGG